MRLAIEKGVTNVALIPAVAMVLGTLLGVYTTLPVLVSHAVLVIALTCGWIGYLREWPWPRVTSGVAAGFLAVACLRGVTAVQDALRMPAAIDLRDEPPSSLVEGTLIEDAAETDYGAALLIRLDRIGLDGAGVGIARAEARCGGPCVEPVASAGWRPTRGTLRLVVNGQYVRSRLDEWRAGRRVRATIRVRAPPAYRNFNLVDRQVSAALRGVHVHGSVKSAVLVEVVSRGPWWSEAAASVRAYVRRTLRAHVGRDPPGERGHKRGAQDVQGREGAREDAGRTEAGREDAGRKAVGQDAARREVPGQEAAVERRTSEALAVAIVTGDRAGLAPDTEASLQRAGTIHILAISGGNIALLAFLMWKLAIGLGLSPRRRAILVMVLLLLHAQIVSGGTSVARATFAAVMYLTARAMEHGTRPLNVLGVVVAALTTVWPLSVGEPAFWLSVMASVAIVISARPLAEWLWRTSGSTLMRLRWILFTPRLQPRARSWRHRLQRRWLRGRRGRARRMALSVLRAAGWTQRATVRACGAVLWGMLMLGAATMAVESAIVPFTAYFFSQVTVAGLVGNLLAVPAAALVQVGALMCLALSSIAPSAADGIGDVVHWAARAIVREAVVSAEWPWLAARVPAPPVWLVMWCVAGWWLVASGLGARASIAAALRSPWLVGISARLGLLTSSAARPPLPSAARARVRARSGPFSLERLTLRQCVGAAWMAGLVVVWFQPWLPALPASIVAPRGVEVCREPAWPERASGRWLRMTSVDVAQGDATLIRFPGGEAWLVDAGGVASARFDIGARVVAPALWALGIRRLDTVVLTHEDIDHVGGAVSVLRDFGPRVLWHGDGVESTLRKRLEVIAMAKRERILERVGWRSLARGDGEPVGRVAVRVWHPSAPLSSEVLEGRRGMRDGNDRSLVLELRMDSVALLLPGDIGAGPERELSSLLRTAPMTILKAPHHGSRFSSTDVFLDGWRPAVAIVSAGRNNPYGHPADATLHRYRARDIPVFRTDLDGAVAIDTDGTTVRIASCSGRQLVLQAPQHVPVVMPAKGGA